jgi:transcriptional regulator with XRE-family HTH domain
MQKQRQVHGWTGKQVAKAFGCNASHVSRVEQGKNRPSRELVRFYDEKFGADGLLLSLFEAVAYAGEQQRRRPGGRRPQPLRSRPGDSSEFIDDTVPHGTLMQPGQFFVKTWRIRNTGRVQWTDRQIERQGPLTGPGLMSSMQYYDVPDTKPGDIAEIFAVLKAPTYACSSIAYFKMVDADGALCFPDSYQLGLDVLIKVQE